MPIEVLEDEERYVYGQGFGLLVHVYVVHRTCTFKVHVLDLAVCKRGGGSIRHRVASEFIRVSTVYIRTSGSLSGFKQKNSYQISYF